MPRTPKKDEESELTLTDEQKAAIEEEKRVEEAEAAYFAAQSKSGEGEDGSPEVDEAEAEPVLGGPAGETDGESSDPSTEEGAGDGEDIGESSTPEAETQTPDNPVPVVPEREKTAAELRPTAMGGSTIYTQ